MRIVCAGHKVIKYMLLHASIPLHTARTCDGQVWCLARLCVDLCCLCAGLWARCHLPGLRGGAQVADLQQTSGHPQFSAVQQKAHYVRMLSAAHAHVLGGTASAQQVQQLQCYLVLCWQALHCKRTSCEASFSQMEVWASSTGFGEGTALTGATLSASAFVSRAVWSTAALPAMRAAGEGAGAASGACT